MWAKTDSAKSVPGEIKNIFYSATDDVFRTISRNFVDIELEGWVAKKAEVYITDGSQKDIIGNNILPALGIEVRQKKVAAHVHEVKTDSQPSDIHWRLFADSTQVQYI